jgi:hypothetical protein
MGQRVKGILNGLTSAVNLGAAGEKRPAGGFDHLSVPEESPLWCRAATVEQWRGCACVVTVDMTVEA